MTGKNPIRNIPPGLKPPREVLFPKPAIHRLRNGIEVYMIDGGSQEVLSVELFFRAGSWYQPQPFVAMAANLMLSEGTRSYTSEQLSERLDYFGAHFQNNTERDSAYFSLYTLNKFLPDVMPLLAEAVRFPAFPESEFSILAAKERQMLEVNLQKVKFLARVGFNPIIFGGEHPYGVTLQPADIEKVTVDHLKEFHRNHYHQANCYIVVSGRIRENVLPLLEQYFGDSGWSGSAPGVTASSIAPAREKEHFQRKEGAVQSAIRIGSSMVKRNHADYPGLRVLNTILGGYFGSRLMSNLREDKGYTYGIGSALVTMQHAGFFVIMAETGTDVTRLALKEINTELLRLCNEPVPENELQLVRNYMMGELMRSVDGPLAQAYFYRNLLEDGLTNGYMEHFVETVRNITAAQLQNLAQKYFDPSLLYTLVVGPEDYN